MDERSERNILLNVLAGIGLGAIVGAAVALVLAPKPGTEVREDIRGTLDDLKTKAERVAGDLASRAEELVTKGRSAVDTAQAKIKEAVSAGREAMTEVQEEVAEKVEGVG